jgi:ssDNA-binding Zn-finger/Zn-ribbon topoisomerase 1
MVKKKEDDGQKEAQVCPKCGSALGEIITTKSGKRFQRCSAGSWNAETRQVEGCFYVKWLPVEPEVLDEKCPKCGAPLILTSTRFGKKLKKCSTNTWDPKTKTATGCDYIEWVKGTTEELEETCPKCGAKLVLFTSASGKKLKKCSTNKWDPETRQATGCDYTQWL